MISIVQNALRQPGFHDGHLLGVFADESLFRMLLRTVEGDEYELSITGLEALRVLNFKEGNIILDIMIYTGSECPPEGVGCAYSVDDSDSVMKNVEQYYERFVRNNRCLLQVMSSYGCELFAVFRGPVNAGEISLIKR